MENKKVALVTGASSGIGYYTALELMDRGFKVYGAARRVEKMKDLETKGIKTIKLDVTDEQSMKNCVDTILSDEESIDVLINNAGYGSYGAVEDVPLEEARRQLDVNVFGLARMTQLVLPGMRKKHFGKIVNITSMGGKMHSPFGGWYHATKFAVEALSDCMRMELAPHGIDIIIVEPGAIKTDWGEIAADNLIKTSKGGAYEATATKQAEAMKKMYSSSKLSEPTLISKTIGKAVTAKHPKTRYLVGFGAKPAVFARRILSDRMFDRVSKRMM